MRFLFYFSWNKKKLQKKKEDSEQFFICRRPAELF